MRRLRIVSVVLVIASAAACQALLDFDPDVVVSGAADGSAEGGAPPNDATPPTDERQAPAVGPPRELWKIETTTSGIAATATDVFWVVDKTIFARSKQNVDAATPRSVTIECPTGLVGPVAYGSHAFVACGRSPQGYVIRYAWNGLGPSTQTSIYDQGSEVLALAASAAGIGIVFTYLDVALACCYALNAPPPVWVDCTPGRAAAANERAFYYVDKAGSIVTVNWAGVASAPVPPPIAGVASMSATDDALYLAGAGGLARMPLQDGGANVVDDTPSSLVAAWRDRIAFVRGGRVWLTTQDLAAPEAVSLGADVPEHSAIDGDGVYWKAADGLWVAPFCPGNLCQQK